MLSCYHFLLLINYLFALKRIHILLGETEQAEISKKKVEIWKNKLEIDIKESKRKSKSR